MTPIQSHLPNHERILRRYLNHTPRQQAVILLNHGYEWEDACLLVGYDEWTENRHYLKWYAVILAVCCIAAIVYLSYVGGFNVSAQR